MELDKLRSRIDKIDDELIDLLEQRLKIAKAIAEYKVKHNLSIEQPEREKAVLEKLMHRAKKKGLNHKFIKELYELIFQESKDLQFRSLKIK